MIIHLQFGFSQFISFREEDLIGPGSHVEYPTGTKNRNFVEDHPRTFLLSLVPIGPVVLEKKLENVKSLQTTDELKNKL